MIGEQFQEKELYRKFFEHSYYYWDNAVCGEDAFPIVTSPIEEGAKKYLNMGSEFVSRFILREVGIRL